MWLDETMSYSCGYFKHPEDTLYQAQVQKVERILEKLYLKEGSIIVCRITLMKNIVLYPIMEMGLKRYCFL